MKKTKKYFIIILAFVVLFAGGIAVLKLTEKPASEEEGSSSDAGTNDIIGRELKDLKKLTVQNKNNTDDIIIDISFNSDDEPEYAVEGLEDLGIQSSAVKSISTYGYTLFVNKELGVLDNLAEYGLDNPAVTVTSEFTDGTKLVYYVGSANPSGGYYVRLDGKDDVYVVSFSDNFFISKSDLVTTDLIALPTADSSGNEITVDCESLNIGGTNYEKEVKIKKTTENIFSSHLMTQPINGTDGYYCDDDFISALIKSVSTVTAQSVACENPTDEQLAAYGLDNPCASLDFKVSYTMSEDDGKISESHKIIAGVKQADGTYPIMVDDIPVVYFAADTVVAYWYDKDPFIFRSTFIILPQIDTVKNVSIKTAEENHTFEKTRTEKESSESSEETSYDYSVTNTAGKELTYATFQKYYRTLLSLTLLGNSEETVSGSPILSVTYKYYDGGADTLAFYQSELNNRQYVATLNGTVYGIVRKTTVDEFLTSTANIENDICDIE